MNICSVFHGKSLNNGVDWITLLLIINLKRQGINIYAVVPEEGTVSKELTRRGIPWSKISYSCCTAGYSWRGDLQFIGDAASSIAIYIKLFKLNSIDLVHVNTGHMLGPALAASKVDIPLVWHIHSPFEIDFQRYRYLFEPSAYEWILENMGNKVIAVSKDIGDSLSRHLRTEQIDVIYNGVDAEELQFRADSTNTSIKLELGLSEVCSLVLGVGRISDQKDFTTFVCVAKKVVDELPNTCFIIAGSPENQPLVEDLILSINKLGLKRHVFILGQRHDIPALMKQSDLMLSTSIYEGHPLVILEMMAMERPIVAMACVGLRECINDPVDGVLTPLGDIDGTALSVIELLKDEERRKTIGSRARKTIIDTFSMEVLCHKFMSLAETTINKHKSIRIGGAIDVIDGMMSLLNRAHLSLRSSDHLPGLFERIGKKIDSSAKIS